MSDEDNDRLVLISADGHSGGNHEQYRYYLEARYLEAFDTWRAQYSNPFKDLSGSTRNRNWDDDRRISELEADGVVAEVIFPNTIPPFFPTYPHDESTYPNTREGVRRAFAGTPRDELRRLLAGNAAAVYGFDLDCLAPLAARVGPTFAELSVPYRGIPEGNRSPAFTRD